MFYQTLEMSEMSKSVKANIVKVKICVLSNMYPF